MRNIWGNTNETTPKIAFSLIKQVYFRADREADIFLFFSWINMLKLICKAIV